VNRQSISDCTYSIEDAVLHRRRLKSSGKTFVLTNGCFDLLHAGHVSSLVEASQFGDELWVAVNSDLSVSRIKGTKRPIIPQLERAYMVKSLECVSGVIIFETDRLTEQILLLQPDIYVKSCDYNENTIDASEKESLKMVNAKLKFTCLIDSLSTSKIIDKIRLLSLN